MKPDVDAAWLAWMAAAPVTTRSARCGDLIRLRDFLSSTVDELRDAQPREIASWLAGRSDVEARALAAAWIDWARVQGHRETTIGRRISTISSWWRELASHGLPWSVRLSRPKVRAYQFHACAWADVVRVLQKLAAESRTREHLAIAVLAWLGLRRAEAVSLRAQSIDRGRGTIEVRRKGGRLVRLTVPPELLELIERALEGRTRGALITSARGAAMSASGLADLVSRVGLWSPHAIRHAAATELYRRTHDAALVSAFLDHVHLATTQVYVHVLDDHAATAAAMLAAA